MRVKFSTRRSGFGASANVDSPGHDYVRSIVEFGFAGAIYPINPRATEILGLRAYPSLADVPGSVDLVISCIPADGVLDLIAQAKAKGATALHLFTGRFSETGDERAAALERQVQQAAAAAGIRIIGPNCMGVYDSTSRLSFRPDLPQAAGDVAFISQSGNNSVELMLHGAARGLRFSKVVSYGNALDLTEADFLEHWRTTLRHASSAYIEGTSDGRRLRCAADVRARNQSSLKSRRTAPVAHRHRTRRRWRGGDAWSAVLQAGAVRGDVRQADRCWWRSRSGGEAAAMPASGGGGTCAIADVCEEAGLRVPAAGGLTRGAAREGAKPGVGR
jgi:acyl-CoA synthetase (NDP forming)